MRTFTLLILLFGLSESIFGQAPFNEPAELIAWPKLAINPHLYTGKKVVVYGWASIVKDNGVLALIIYEDYDSCINGNRSKCVAVDDYVAWCKKVNLSNSAQQLLNRHYISATAFYSYQNTSGLGWIKNMQSIIVHDVPIKLHFDIALKQGDPFGK